MSENSSRITDYPSASIREVNLARTTAEMREIAREDEEYPPDLSLAIETEIGGVRYTAFLDVYRGEGDEPDEHHIQSEFGNWCVTPPLSKGLGGDALRVWAVQNLRDLHEHYRTQNTPRGQARM